ncbi:unnamed protein product, partial [marine sediment metagenome]
VKELMELLTELNEKFNITIIAINHHLDLLTPYCSRLLLMDGTIEFDGNPNDKRVKEIIDEIFIK